jgi:NAD(P)-dependent dehydrogenase (short-subunit alcohol dehydrogenase family)
MAGLRASQLLRAQLLDGVSLLLAGAVEPAPKQALGPAVADAFASLGASVFEIPVRAREEQALDQAVGNALAGTGRIDMLAVDCAGVFGEELAEHGDSQRALRGCVQSAWNATRALANGAFLPAGAGGRVVYLAAPAGYDGAGALRAALENLARTLSTEWARHQLTTVTLAPAAEGAADEVAALVAYLASPAGAYFSGCVLEVGC